MHAHYICNNNYNNTYSLCYYLAATTTTTNRSLDFFSQYGTTAVVCPPDRLPIARIAAAQTEIRTSNKCK